MADIRLLPGPIIDEWDWQLHGACRGMDSSFFFHPDGERGPRREHRASEAKKVCARCPVLEPCRRHALATREPYGVWGGLTEDERRVALNGRARGAVRGAVVAESPQEIGHEISEVVYEAPTHDATGSTRIDARA